MRNTSSWLCMTAYVISLSESGIIFKCSGRVIISEPTEQPKSNKYSLASFPLTGKILCCGTSSSITSTLSRFKSQGVVRSIAALQRSNQDAIREGDVSGTFNAGVRLAFPYQLFDNCKAGDTKSQQSSNNLAKN